MRRSPIRSVARSIALVALAAACGEAPPPPAEVAAVPVAAAAPAAPSLPDAVPDLGSVVPADAGFVVELPSIDKLAEILPADARDTVATLRPFAEGGVAGKLGLESSVVHALVDAIDRATIFGDASSAVAVARFRDRTAVEKLVAAMKPIGGESAPGVREVFAPPAAPSQRLVWYPRPRILVLATSAAAAERVERTGTGATASFVKSPHRLPDDPASVRIYADLAALLAKDPGASGLFDAGSFARADVGFGADGRSVRSKLELSLAGPKVPRVADVLAASKPALAARLPEETVLFASASIARKEGKKLGDLVAEIGRASGNDALPRLADAGLRTQLGLGLDDLDALLGGEITLGVAAAPGARIDLDAASSKLDDLVLFAAAPTRDEARAKKLVAAVGKAFGGKNAPKSYKVAATPGSVRFTPTATTSPPLRVETHKGALVFEAGGAKWMDRLGAALDRGERPLGATSAYAASATALDRPENGVIWVDVDRAAKALTKSGKGGDAKFGLARLLLAPSGRGLDMTIESEGGADAFLFGSGAAVAIAGVQRYLVQAKVAEAKNTIGAIARAAAASYEAERQGPSGAVVHRLCKSAQAVPAKVPASTKYQPSDAPNADFNAGDDERGWRCLRFAIATPHYYQYEYRQGGPYKGPARGGPDPGPNGFEVSAEGDLDGNGKTSLFTRVGKIDPATRALRVSPDLFVSDESE